MSVQGNEGQADTGAPEGSTAVIVDGEGGTTNEPIQGQEDQGGEQQQEAEAQSQEEQQQRDDKGRFKSGLQDRIDELTRKRHEADREAAYWRSVAEGKQAQQSADAAPVKPTPDKFDDYGEYIEALTDWKAEQAITKRMGEESSRRVQETRASTFQERLTQYVQANPGFAEAMQENAYRPVAQHVNETVLESEFGPQLLNHFIQNPEVLDRLNGMNPRQADREIGRIEASFASKPAAPTPPAAKPTKAPAPPSGISQGRNSNTPAPGDMPMDQYMEMRKKQGARWAR